MPTRMRAGTVRATLHRPIVLISDDVKPSWSSMVVANGAKANQTTKVRKKANQVRWRTR
jgi:hypothetical protein